MSRSILSRALAVACGLLAMNSLSAAAAPPVSPVSATPAAAPVGAVSVTGPARVARGVSTAVTIQLPSSVAAVEGRIFVRKAAAEVIGVAPLGGGTALRPTPAGSGYSFGAYGLRAVNGVTTVRLVVYPSKAGHLQVRIAIDAAADGAGHRLQLTGTNRVATLGVGHGTTVFAAPDATPGPLPSRSAGPVRELFRNGKFDSQDLNTARGDWNIAHRTGKTCGPAVAGDANGDGCVDIVDLQAELAAKGQRTGTASSAAAAPAAIAGHTFTVNSTADTADAAPGDGACADVVGLCTLRAAMTEADWLAGDDRIEFALVGPAPVTIQLGSALPIVTSTNGTVTIDGYTETGSQVNTATVGSNAVMGVELRGNGYSAHEIGLYLTSAGNTIRGLLIDNFYEGIFVDGSGAHDNRIIGNWIGFTKLGGNPGSGNFAVIFNTGANHNFNGTPNLADRNVIGNYSHAEENYGPGTDFNTTQNNVMCMTPTGLAATCDTGIDHNFGPKNHLIGGTGPNEKNIIGPTTLQGIEFSHGWDPSTGESTPTWQINDNRAIGNWVGFRDDGSYDAAFRSGLNFSPQDNGQAINCYDGSNNNTIQGNYVASVYDGIQVESPRALNNNVQGNIIGVSPLGEAAPLTRWGVVVRWSATYDIVQSNTIRNAAAGGVGLLDTDNDGGATAPAYNIRISRNIVTDTSGPAIALFGTANDSVQPPVITSATTAAVSGTAVGGATVEVYRASRAAGQSGLPTAFLGDTTAASNGAWNLPVSLQPDDVVTALQIRTDQNTSALAVNVAVPPVGPPPPPPAAPTGLSTTLLQGPQVRLNWTDNSNNETGFSIERAVGAGAFAPLASVGANAVTYTDATVSPGTSYTYRVSAQNAGGSSAYTNTSTADVPSIPAAPTGLTATVLAGPQVRLDWTDNANNETGFSIQRRVGTGAFSALATVGANTTTYTDTTAVAGTTYGYRVLAQNLSGASAYSNTASATIPGNVPAAPTGLTATVQSGPTVRLAWTDHATNETGFSIERQVGSGAFAPLATVGANVVSYTDTAVSPGTTYSYRVRAQNASGSSAYSNTATAAIPSLPAAPTGLTATPVRNGTTDNVTLSWTDHATNETGFKLQRATNATFTANLNGTNLGANVVTTTQTGLPRGVTYYYRVRATNASGTSAWSNVVTVVTP